MAGNITQPTSSFVKSMTCRGCGAAIVIRNTRDSVVAVCSHCQATIDLTDLNFNIIATAQEKMNTTHIIPLGSRGKLKGYLWEIIGYMRRMDKESQFHWDEYLLFNPYQGYRWLTQANGHWNFVKTLKVRPIFITGIQNTSVANLIKSFTFEHRKYKLYYIGQAIVTQVVGEFYWRVQVNETVRVQDFISPPFMLSLEQDSSEQNWSLSEYIELREVAAAFPIKWSWPRKIGVAPNQPSEPEKKWKTVRWQALGFCVALHLLQFVHVITSPNETAFRSIDSYLGQSKNVVSPSFELAHGLGNINLQLHAPLSNTWLSVEGDLVNDKTGDTIPLNETVEYYHGYDSGESWTEGNTTQNEIYSLIPAGTYHLDFTMTGAGPADTSRYVNITTPVIYNLTVKRGVPLWWNFWWTLILLCVYPLWCRIRMNSFETQRWSDSDYSPYSSARQGNDED